MISSINVRLVRKGGIVLLVKFFSNVIRPSLRILSVLHLFHVYVIPAKLAKKFNDTKTKSDLAGILFLGLIDKT